jgi:23S rRNA (cytosine1962-C5)-methyltransferase
MRRCVVDARAVRRLACGHPWVFSNQVLEPPEGAEPGEVVTIAAAKGGDRELGTAFWNPRSLVALRRISAEGREPGRELVRERLAAALALRRRLFPDSDAYRLCHGEADGLPGLLVDAYAHVAVVQALSAGMDRLLKEVVAVLVEDLGFGAVVERDESHARELEGLPLRSGTLAGEAPERVEIRVPPMRMLVDVISGQKTGAFLDQRENRQAAARHARGMRCLDAFCNAGGFAIAAALAGAESVTAVDASQPAIEVAQENARLNGVLACVRVSVNDASADMEARHRRRERFGLVMLDPPSFTRSRKHVPQARRALRDLNRRAMTLVEPGGVIVSSDCSHHVLEATFHELLAEAAQQAGRVLRVLEVRGPSPDHPWLAAMPESRYLKCLIAQVS